MPLNVAKEDAATPPNVGVDEEFSAAPAAPPNVGANEEDAATPPKVGAEEEDAAAPEALLDFAAPEDPLNFAHLILCWIGLTGGRETLSLLKDSWTQVCGWTMGG